MDTMKTKLKDTKVATMNLTQCSIKVAMLTITMFKLIENEHPLVVQELQAMVVQMMDIVTNPKIEVEAEAAKYLNIVDIIRTEADNTQVGNKMFTKDQWSINNKMLAHQATEQSASIITKL